MQCALGVITALAASTLAAHAAEGDLRGRQASDARRAPGQFTVDEAAAERALERTLVRAGALLLRPGELEIDPVVRYGRTERSTPVLVGGTTPVVVEARQQRDTVDAVLGLRLGLPFDAQAEIAIPYSATQDRGVTAFSGVPLAEDDREGAGFGDVVFGLTKTVLREDGLRPDLFVSVIYDSATGSEDGGVPFGSGFHEIGASLTAVRRIDPVVLVATGWYQYALEDGGVRPGDQYGLDLRAVLAISPTTSFRVGLGQTFVDRVRIDGAEAAGSDQLVSTLVLGASGALTRSTLLDIEVGIGLTEDAPNYYLQAAVPFRLSLR